MITARLMVGSVFYKTYRIPEEWPSVTMFVRSADVSYFETEHIPEADAMYVTRADFDWTNETYLGQRVYRSDDAAAIELVAVQGGPQWSGSDNVCSDSDSEPEEREAWECERGAAYVPEWAEPLD